MPNAAKLRRSLPRSLLAACLVTVALSPAQAHDSAHDDTAHGDDDAPGLAERLNDPAMQAKAAIALSALSGALLSLDISPLARAMGTVDPAARDLPPGTTLGDIAGAGMRDLPRDLARRTPKAMGAMAGMVGSMEAMGPQLKAMGRQLKDQMRRSLPEE